MAKTEETAMTEPEFTDVVEQPSGQLQLPADFDAAIRQAATSAVEALGESIQLVQDKDSLVGVELLVVDYRQRDGGYGDFVSVYARTRDGRNIVFNDGSTGVCQQLLEAEPRLPMYVKKGLRKSEYWRAAEAGQLPDGTPVSEGKVFSKKPDGIKTLPAATYYFDTSA